MIGAVAFARRRAPRATWANVWNRPTGDASIARTINEDDVVIIVGSEPPGRGGKRVVLTPDGLVGWMHPNELEVVRVG